MLRRRTALALTAVCLPGLVFAQPGFPERSPRYIVPFPPGGLTDIMARILAQQLSLSWGKAVVIDNRAGGNALIGAEAAAKALPDGHKLLAITLTHAVNATLFPNAPYDFRRDFAVLSVLGSRPLVVFVNAERSPARTLGDMLHLVRTRTLNGGSSGNGSPPHLGLELLRRVAAAGGRLRPLAITGTERHPLVPDVPTARELGLPQLEMTNWTAVLTQSAVPGSLLARLERDIVSSMQAPDVVRRSREAGFQVLGWDAARSTRCVREETDRWATLVTEAQIRPDA